MTATLCADGYTKRYVIYPLDFPDGFLAGYDDACELASPPES